MDLKGAHGILIVSGDKDDIGLMLSERLKNFKTTHLRHLNIEEDEIGSFRLDCLDCGPTVSTLPDNLGVRITFEHFANHLASQRFVVND